MAVLFDEQSQCLSVPGLGMLDLGTLAGGSVPTPRPNAWVGGFGGPDSHENGSRLIILGLAQTTRWLAPVNDTSCDVWSLGDGWIFQPRFTRWFEMHPIECLTDYCLPEYLEFLQTCGVPVITRAPTDLIPTATPFPFDRAVETFGSYFESTIGYMLALAILEGYQEIALFGVDMAPGTVYEAHRNSTEYLIGWARGRGIDVFVPQRSFLLKPTNGLYGATCTGHIAERDAYFRRIRRIAEKYQQRKEVYAG